MVAVASVNLVTFCEINLSIELTVTIDSAHIKFYISKINGTTKQFTLAPSDFQKQSTIRPT